MIGGKEFGCGVESGKGIGVECCKLSECLPKDWPSRLSGRRSAKKWVVARSFSLGALKLAQPYPPSEPTQVSLGFKNLLLIIEASLLTVEDDILVEVSLQTMVMDKITYPS